MNPVIAYLVYSREKEPLGSHINDWDESEDGCSTFTPSHWMPLPPSPKEKDTMTTEFTEDFAQYQKDVEKAVPALIELANINGWKPAVFVAAMHRVQTAFFRQTFTYEEYCQMMEDQKRDFKKHQGIS